MTHQHCTIHCITVAEPTLMCLLPLARRRVEDGSDLFLSLTGTYERSNWLGLPLESIASNPGPAAGLPCMLQHLLSFLEGAHALCTQGLFVQSVGIVLGGAVPGAMPGPGQGGGDSSLLSGLSREMQRALMQRLAPLIDALEDGQELPQVRALQGRGASLGWLLGPFDSSCIITNDQVGLWYRRQLRLILHCLCSECSTV